MVNVKNVTEPKLTTNDMLSELPDYYKTILEIL